MSRYVLTPEDEHLCEQFGQFLQRATNSDLSSLSVSKISSVRGFTCYAQDKYRAYSNDYSERTLPLQDCIQDALDKFYADNPTADERKAQRVEQLRAELACLEGTPA